MTNNSTSREKRNWPLHISKRGAVVFAISFLAHLLTLQWAGSSFGIPSESEPEQSVMMVEIKHAAPEVEAQPVAVVAQSVIPPTPKSKPVMEKRLLPPTPTPTTTVISTAETDATSSTKPTIIAQPENDGALGYEPPPRILAAKAPDPTSPYQVNLPPSAEISYEVQKFSGTQIAYGKAKISWLTDGRTYNVVGEATVLFINLLTFRSEGEIDKFGIAPVIYSEKGRGKSETNTHFQRESNIISFSASTSSYPRADGAQDRASVMWQLASLGRGNPEKFIPDANIDIFVAQIRDADIWQIKIVGEEEIDINTGKMKTWHVVRSPAPGSYDKKIDIWLAPQHDWYPVKIQHTESNGDYLTMLVTDIKPVER